ncbi:MAG: hypothetical protein KF833_01120 [Verrucomicrobiae bacterium]|nr:hypothetical protein [Verrucomicrobiae bacterium]
MKLKRWGYGLLTAGVVLAALLAVQTEEDRVVWGLFIPALGLAVAGVGLVRRARSQVLGDVAAGERDTRVLEESIGRINGHLREINARVASGDGPETLHEWIDRTVRDDLSRFAEARRALIGRYGLPAYAEVMNRFAAGERYLNRVWSASVDGYDGEARRYLDQAREQMEEVGRLLEVLKAGGGSIRG